MLYIFKRSISHIVSLTILLIVSFTNEYNIAKENLSQD